MNIEQHHCHICGERLVQTFDAFTIHVNRFHPSKQTAFKSVKAIKPERLTSRTKAEIVFDMEKMWGQAVYPPVKPWTSYGDVVPTREG